MSAEIISQNARETRKIAALLAGELKNNPPHGAAVVALEGELGSGKTTFVQGLARALGVRENVLSPTFVLMKIYRLTKVKKFKHLIHVDCYRLDLPEDLIHLGFRELLKDKDAVILVEWANRVRKLIPRDAPWIRFRHGKRPHERILKISV